VYEALLRQQLATVQHGEHGRACEPEDVNAPVRIVATTQPLPSNTPKRDAGWVTYLPAQAGPLLAALRAMNTQPALDLDAARLALGRPVTLVPEEVAAPTLWPTEQTTTGSISNASALWWFSRVAYTLDGEWALVYAVRVCPGVIAATVEEPEMGEYEQVFLAALQRRAGNWIVNDPLYLDVGLPRLEPRHDVIPGSKRQ
jgi:hypothetical protein